MRSQTYVSELPNGICSREKATIFNLQKPYPEKKEVFNFERKTTY
jgi:hypothetical protein